MNPAVSFVIVVFAFGVAWYAAYSMGRYWTESKIVGGMTRLLVIASVALSALGFTGVYFILILLVLGTFTTVLSPLDVHTLFPVSLGVLSVPGAGAVPGMWMNSQVAMQRGQFVNAMNAGASLRMNPGDVLDMTLNSPPGLFEWLGDMFKGGGGGGGDDDSGELMLIVIILIVAIIALLAGVFTTIAIVRAADKEHVGEIIELYRPSDTAS